MKIEEAISHILHRIEENKDFLDGLGLRTAGYDQIQAFELAVDALQSKIPKEPVGVDNGTEWEMSHYHCPSCGHIVYRSNFCESCSQALDWGDEDE